MQAMANLAILTKSCHSHNGGEFGKISANSQINANKLNTWKPAMLVDLTIFELQPLAKYRQICQFRQIRRIRRSVGTLLFFELVQLNFNLWRNIVKFGFSPLPAFLDIQLFQLTLSD